MRAKEIWISQSEGERNKGKKGSGFRVKRQRKRLAKGRRGFGENREMGDLGLQWERKGPIGFGVCSKVLKKGKDRKKIEKKTKRPDTLKGYNLAHQGERNRTLRVPEGS